MQIDRKINSKQLREMLGDISDMSLWRLLHDKYLKFPQPTYVNRRRFWSSKEIQDGLTNSPNEFGDPVCPLPKEQ